MHRYDEEKYRFDMNLILEMTEKRLGCVGVRGPDGGLSGIITDGDLRRQMAPRLIEKTAGEAMTASPVTIAAAS